MKAVTIDFSAPFPYPYDERDETQRAAAYALRIAAALIEVDLKTAVDRIRAENVFIFVMTLVVEPERMSTLTPEWLVGRLTAPDVDYAESTRDLGGGRFEVVLSQAAIEAKETFDLGVTTRLRGQS